VQSKGSEGEKGRAKGQGRTPTYGKAGRGGRTSTTHAIWYGARRDSDEVNLGRKGEQNEKEKRLLVKGKR